MFLKPKYAPKTYMPDMKKKKDIWNPRQVYKATQTYQRYSVTKRLLLPRDKASRVYPKLDQSTIKVERLNQLANFTAANVGTDGGFYRSRKKLHQDTNSSRKGTTILFNSWTRKRIKIMHLHFLDKMLIRRQKKISILSIQLLFLLQDRDANRFFFPITSRNW